MYPISRAPPPPLSRSNKKQTVRFGACIVPEGREPTHADMWVYASNGSLFNRGNVLRNKLPPFNANSTLRFTLDLDTCTLSVAVNGRDYGTAFRHVKGVIHPAVSFGNRAGKSVVELVAVSSFVSESSTVALCTPT